MKSFCEVWEEIHAKNEWGKYPSESVVRFVARNYYKKDREKIRILDFGCGGGATTWFLAREGFDVYAFDGSKSAIEKAKMYLRNEGYHKVHFDVADALQIGYESSFFDCVIDNACIYANRIEEIKTMYSKVYDILNEEGKLFSSCFGTKTDGYNTGCSIEKDTFENIEKGVLAGRGRAHFFNKETLWTVLEDVGFKNIIIDTMLYTDNGITVELLIAQGQK